jgi:hypothetical protein
MLKWLIALCVTVFVAGFCLPRLTAWLRIGRMPGDLRCRFRRREYYFPFGSTIALSLLASLILYFLHLL